jgi:GNAT superfamily N-acetyltransferase
MEWRHPDGYTISTDPGRVDRQAVWEFLRTSYWAQGIDFDRISRSIDNSLVFSLVAPDGAQAGYARAVTDRVRYGWLGDVFVLDGHRGRGLGVWLVGTVLSHPDLADLTIQLGTADAHGLYARFGFVTAEPGRVMWRRRPGGP